MITCEYTRESFCQMNSFYIGSVTGILLLPYGGEAGDRQLNHATHFMKTSSIKIGEKNYNLYTVSIFLYFQLILKDKPKKDLLLIL